MTREKNSASGMTRTPQEFPARVYRIVFMGLLYPFSAPDVVQDSRELHLRPEEKHLEIIEFPKLDNRQDVKKRVCVSRVSWSKTKINSCTAHEVLGGGNAYRGIGTPPELGSREVGLNLTSKHAIESSLDCY